MSQQQLILIFFSVVVIILAFLFSWAYISSNVDDNKSLAKYRQRIEMLPSFISTLGVIGTFLGITMGLCDFNENDIEASIPNLLGGLKMAFITSLLGMGGSLVLSRVVNAKIDKFSDNQAQAAANNVNGAIANLQNLIGKHFKNQQANNGGTSNILNNMDKGIQSLNTTFEKLMNNSSTTTTLLGNIDQLLQNLCKSAATTENYANSILTSVNATGDIVKVLQSDSNKNTSAVADIQYDLKDMAGTVTNVQESNRSIALSIGNIEEHTGKQNEMVADIQTKTSELVDHTEAMVSSGNEMTEKIQTLTEKMHGEVVEIEDKMTETNGLLERKFDEFSELLKKNNTEALVDVMKRVTEEFQTQMNALISKLVQENFEQLNNSVEKLNQWQVENKEMIESLTKQYRQMANDFQNTSTTLTDVKNDTMQLVSEGGRLDQLVNALNEVIVQDRKFKAVSENLLKTADLSKSNMESFDQSTRKLNEWIKTQRNFSDSVAVLIKKLEDLNEMRNYANAFWQDTKTGMNEAVGIIKEGSKQLNQQINGLDQKFYARLSTTLSQLDECIQALINNPNN